MFFFSNFDFNSFYLVFHLRHIVWKLKVMCKSFDHFYFWFKPIEKSIVQIWLSINDVWNCLESISSKSRKCSSFIRENHRLSEHETSFIDVRSERWFTQSTRKSWTTWSQSNQSNSSKKPNRINVFFRVIRIHFSASVVQRSVSLEWYRDTSTRRISSSID